jgi:FixJ family two-component response regulator
MLGAYDFLAKPCEIDDLVDKIKGAWKKRMMARNRICRKKYKKWLNHLQQHLNCFPKKIRKIEILYEPIGDRQPYCII